jgi:hypothetical protein
MTPTLAKVRYVWTANDTTNGFATVPVTWRRTMNGDYIINWSIEDRGLDINIGDYWQGDMHAVTPNGFNAIVFSYSPGQGTAGDVIYVHAMAMEWNGGA